MGKIKKINKKEIIEKKVQLEILMECLKIKIKIHKKNKEKTD
jgi:hypothetical protein